MFTNVFTHPQVHARNQKKKRRNKKKDPNPGTVHNSISICKYDAK
jgi:hypothetical protein